ncbi:MAG TPA: maltose alpha-D-glucosyltransferase [Kofleriaceae bacterium]|jgi:maltose alpha-D-glucosyltransferase/alpha-amylase|nr:maltose alpha-D-glucosyltransferase [Kofleriaceae bacterium]
MTDIALSDDPLWFKDAIVYEIHIRAFQDSTNDGIGDINGLIDRLDYLCDLGITAIWLLPFYPSPLKDGGYDIADYTSVHEHYGTREDFARLLHEAHRRGIRVITELVLNHTSADHPWFQAARRAPAGSPERDFYVWSDTPARYEDTRIIFKDYETSNWSWDPVAKAYYWHRFYVHQPDLNFDNPAVHDALFRVIDFWLEMGVDGLRLDAVPYLYEREGTSCENLDETHAFLRRLRAHIDAKFKNRMLLAEANQWPADAAAYFGGGDECHMNFHFPLMPRMFMALETEDSFPIVNILKRTPKIPEMCQWATFLRNHDELTLEMVTDEDRDTMYRGYAAERAARINLGIRRRLAPLLGVRRKIELMTALLLSLPGTPVLYYGDEIGMGDNIYLGDRDGVRTPMQWSSDRNGGFSRANPQKLYLPTIIDPEYHYEAINVEAQQGNPSSLLWWMKRLLAKRKEYRLFGRGSIEFIPGDNPRVLAFLREYEGEMVLVVANLSRSVQCARLKLERFKAMVPVELFGRTRFPEILEAPYFLSLGPHDFYWIALERPQSALTGEPASSERPVLTARASWTAVLEPARRAQLARILLDYAIHRRWFRGKARTRKQVSISDVLTFEADSRHAIVLLHVEYDHGRPETYVVPVGFVEDPDHDAARSPGLVIARVAVSDVAERGAIHGILYDAVSSEAFCSALLGAMLTGGGASGRSSRLTGEALPALRDAVASGLPLAARAMAVDQSNSSVLYGDHFLLKLFRVVEDGPSSELEISRMFAARDAGYRGVPALAGLLEYRQTGHEPGTLGTLFEFVPNQGDAWRLAMDEIDRYYDRVLTDERHPEPPGVEPGSLVERARLPLPDRVVDLLGPFLDHIRLLGRRTAELHLQLAAVTDDAVFAPEQYDILHQQSMYGTVVAHAARTFDLLRSRLTSLGPEQRALAEVVLAHEADLDRVLAQVTRRRIDVIRTRTHGDYHLGQVLWTGDNFVIIDFEGEPGRPLSHRRFKYNPLRDVAGMLESLRYAGVAELRSGRHRPEDVTRLEPWARAWSRWMSAAFLGGYLEAARGSRILPRSDADLVLLLEFFVLEKVVYEIGYELNNRPDWLEIPMRALLELLERLPGGR